MTNTKVLSGLCALALALGVTVACNREQVSESPGSSRTPAASPPTAPPASGDSQPATPGTPGAQGTPTPMPPRSGN